MGDGQSTLHVMDNNSCLYAYLGGAAFPYSKRYAVFYRSCHSTALQLKANLWEKEEITGSCRLAFILFLLVSIFNFRDYFME